MHCWSRRWDMDRKHWRWVFEDPWTASGQSGSCCHRDKRAGKKEITVDLSKVEHTISLSNWCTDNMRVCCVSFRSQWRPSVWRLWTGSLCPSNRKSRSPACGFAVFLPQTVVHDGAGGSKRESLRFGNETTLKVYTYSYFLNWDSGTTFSHCDDFSLSVIISLWW